MKKFFAAIIFLLIISAQASAMDLKINRDADWSIRLAEEPFTLKIEGHSRLDGNFSKGVGGAVRKFVFSFRLQVV